MFGPAIFFGPDASAYGDALNIQSNQAVTADFSFTFDDTPQVLNSVSVYTVLNATVTINGVTLFKTGMAGGSAELTTDTSNTGDVVQFSASRESDFTSAAPGEEESQFFIRFEVASGATLGGFPTVPDLLDPTVERFGNISLKTDFPYYNGQLSFVSASSVVGLELNEAFVPEPETWALMIGGFGLAGSALRRRRSVAA